MRKITIENGVIKEQKIKKKKVRGTRTRTHGV